MKLVIGGNSQGKLNYVLSKYHLQEEMVWDGVLPDHTVLQRRGTVVINHFHLWIRHCILNDGCPEDEILPLLDCQDDLIIISDEVGNGIVPLEPFEREYRERVGRILVRLAERAEEVERVICGIAQKIK